MVKKTEKTGPFLGQIRREFTALVRCPVAGDIIKGSGGLRKLRWSASGRGKRGGSRVICYWFKDLETIYMLYAYAKNRQEDLTRDQLKILSKLVEEELK